MKNEIRYIDEKIVHYDFDKFLKCKNDNPHHFPIGLWGCWWLDNFGGHLEEEKRIYNRKRWKAVDLAFLDKNRELVGLLEVENGHGSRPYKKVMGFNWFENKKKEEDIIYKNLQFCILMTWAQSSRNGNLDRKDKDGNKFVKNIKEYIIKQSRKSKMKWILFITKWLGEDDYAYVGYDYFIMERGKEKKYRGKHII